MSCCFPSSWPRRGRAQESRQEPDRVTRLQAQVTAAAAKSINPDILAAALDLLNTTEIPMRKMRSSTKKGASVIIRQTSQTWMQVVREMNDLKDHAGKFGLDIGGTLVKCALMQVQEEDGDAKDASSGSIPTTFGHSGQLHEDLSFETEKIGEKRCVLRFISGETERLDNVLKSARAATGASNGGDARVNDQKRLDVVATGGGAHRLAAAFLESMGVRLEPFLEMESLVGGLAFLHEYGPEDEIFTYTLEGEKYCVPWPQLTFPCLLVNMGSGVSILRVDAAPDFDCQRGGNFSRLGGNACGGATFLGLARLLTSATTFAGALELAVAGDPTRVNKLVSDIYGAEGSKALGLPGELTAAYYGKLATKAGDVRKSVDEKDVAAALLMLIVQESVVLSRALAASVEFDRPEDFDEPTPIFFVGGFLANNPLAQKIISRTFLRLEGRSPFFLKHADFLGALGAVGRSL